MLQGWRHNFACVNGLSFLFGDSCFEPVNPGDTHCCFPHFLPMDQLGRASRKLPISVGLGYFCLMQDSRILRCPVHLQKTRKTNPARERDAFNNCTSQGTGVSAAAAAANSQLSPLHLHLYISITKLRPSARKPS